MIETKTGALVCKIPDSRNEFSYRPLAFITGIPLSYSDEDFKAAFDTAMLGDLIKSCDEILFRADIHSTSNEVQEEYEKLHADSNKIPQFHFRKNHLSSAGVEPGHPS
jgi:hypothetical protein